MRNFLLLMALSIILASCMGGCACLKNNKNTSSTLRPLYGVYYGYADHGIWYHLILKKDTFYLSENIGEFSIDSEGTWTISGKEIIFRLGPDPMGIWSGYTNSVYRDTLLPGKIVDRKHIKLVNQCLDYEHKKRKMVSLKLEKPYLNNDSVDISNSK